MSGDHVWLYEELEVDPQASAEEIRRAYRRLAPSAHPDTHPADPDAPRRFRALTQAYEVLSDPQRRASYDRRHVARPAPQPAQTVRTDPMVTLTAPVTVGAAPPLRAGPVRIDPSTPRAGRPRPGSADDRLLRLVAEFLRTGRDS